MVALGPFGHRSYSGDHGQRRPEAEHDGDGDRRREGDKQEVARHRRRRPSGQGKKKGKREEKGIFQNNPLDFSVIRKTFKTEASCIFLGLLDKSKNYGKNSW